MSAKSVWWEISENCYPIDQSATNRKIPSNELESIEEFCQPASGKPNPDWVLISAYVPDTRPDHPQNEQREFVSDWVLGEQDEIRSGSRSSLADEIGNIFKYVWGNVSIGGQAIVQADIFKTCLSQRL